MEADFLAIYHIKNPYKLRGDKFIKLAERTYFYKGAVRGRIELDAQLEQQEQQNTGHKPTSKSMQTNGRRVHKNPRPEETMGDPNLKGMLKFRTFPKEG